MRRRITTLATAITAVVLVAVAAVVLVAVRTQLLQQLDRALDQRAADLAASYAASGGSTVTTSDPEDHFAQVLDGDGTVLAATENATALIADWPLPSEGTTVFELGDLPLEDDVYRVLVRRESVAGRPGWIVVGENVDDLRDTLRNVATTLALAIPIALAVLAAVAWWLVGRTLRPVELIRLRVDEIGAADLSQRVPAPGTGDEVEALADTMNEMLGRLDDSAARQRQLVADASHELRTPLTRLRTNLEVDLAHPGSDRDATISTALGDIAELDQLVDDLLLVASVDARAVLVGAEIVDLDAIAADQVSAARPAATVGGVAIDGSKIDAVQVRGDAGALARVIRNLIANAVRHARARVTVTLEQRDDAVVLTVADDGPGIAPADRERVFDRFVRLDEARSGHRGGSGLGLAIVRELAVAHGGSVGVTDGPDGGAALVVTLPRTG